MGAKGPQTRPFQPRSHGGTLTVGKDPGRLSDPDGGPSDPSKAGSHLRKTRTPNPSPFAAQGELKPPRGALVLLRGALLKRKKNRHGRIAGQPPDVFGQWSS